MAFWLFWSAQNYETKQVCKQRDEFLRKFCSPLYENGLEEVTDVDFNLPSLIELLKMMDDNPESFDDDKDTEASRGWESQRMLDF